MVKKIGFLFLWMWAVPLYAFLQVVTNEEWLPSEQWEHDIATAVETVAETKTTMVDE
jgi:hypothetical protein